jgi:hypothetical protein
MVTMARDLGARAPALMVDSRCRIGRGQTLPPAGPRRRPGGVLLHTSGYLGLLLTMVLIPIC